MTKKKSNAEVYSERTAQSREDKKEDRSIDAERQELNLLINKGVSFEVERTIFVPQKGLLGRLKKRIPKTDMLKFVVHEPTLSTLDRISAEQIELRIDENIMSTEAGVPQAKKMAHEHGRRLARIVAIAVTGTDCLKSIQEGAHVKYVYDDSKIEELTELFFQNIKPSKLINLAIMVNTVSNLGDFTNSIRLMSATRTTMPIRIEEDGV